MKKIIFIISTVVVLGSILTGCAGNKELISKVSSNSRQDVFQETQTAQQVSGKAILKIDFPVKNFKARFINTYVKHTDPPYTAVLNIDGQATVITDEPKLEDLPGDFKENPEVGTGWKYNFRKTLILQPGKHRVSIALPVSDIIIEKEVDLREGENTLELSPVYIASISRYPNSPRFSHGVRGVTAKLNSKEL